MSFILKLIFEVVLINLKLWKKNQIKNISFPHYMKDMWRPASISPPNTHSMCWLFSLHSKQDMCPSLTLHKSKGPSPIGFPLIWFMKGDHHLIWTLTKNTQTKTLFFSFEKEKPTTTSFGLSLKTPRQKTLGRYTQRKWCTTMFSLHLQR